MKGQILKIHSDFYYVKCEGLANILECKIREVLKKTRQKVLVGDFVECNIINDFSGVVEKVLPRMNFLTRPSVANVEQAIIISSVKEPTLDFEQLNRYICFAKYHNIKTKLCFNKTDLSDDDSVIEKVFEIYEPLGFEIVFTSAIEHLGIEDFEELLGNKTTVICGCSGVGKSSLIKALAPNINIRTQEVSEKTLKGTHTTRHCEIISINTKNEPIKIIDTPGFSNLKFDFLLPTRVGDLFDEFAQYRGQCKYADCLHLQEDGCAIIENINLFDASRYESYKNFVLEAKAYKEKIKRQGNKIEATHKSKLNKNYVKISARKRESARNTKKQQIYKDIENE